ncbi:MAG: glycosyltransferase family 39 protein [Bryobacteraceae bacterium]
MGGRRDLLIVVAVVFLLRLPFLNQAIQGDDVNYLAGAQHALIDPLHPTHAKYVFLGDLVDMRGHPHPPLNAWFLGLLLALFGDVYEVPFHAAYIPFSLISALSMLALARRFSPQPLLATLLFLAVPAFVINGNSLESDLPFLAFWMLAIALFVRASDRRSIGLLAASALSMALAAMAAYQAIFLTPILAVWVWLRARDWRPAWAATLTAPLVFAIWQASERLSSGALPAAVLVGYFETYGFQALEQKIRNAIALTVHTGWMVFPVLLPPAILAAWRRRDKNTVFLFAWIALFFLGALAVFFAGSARYLLPMAAPLALLVSHLPRKWLAAGVALQLPLSLALATVNYQHWDGYRQFVRSLSGEMRNRRVWINGEWGLRFYLEAEGGLALQRDQAVRPGDLIVSSELALPIPFTMGGGAATPLAQEEIHARLPLRLIGLNVRSAYSSASKGFLPFDVSTGPIDRVRAELVSERPPSLEYVPMNAPEAERHIISGIYGLEDGRWRWMGQRGVLLLKVPENSAALRVFFTIPGIAEGPRHVRVLIDSEEVAEGRFPGPGSYTLAAPPRKISATTTTVSIVVDRIITAPGDRRELGIILTEAGFVR